MSQTVYTVLDLSHPVSHLSFREAFQNRDGSSPSNTSVQLSEAQLSSLVKVLFTYGLHYDEVHEEQRPVFMDSIKENAQGMFDIPQSFCGHFLNNLDEGSKSEFHKLLEMEHDLKNLLSNEALMDFVEMELIDPTVSYRKWEYGRYALDHMGKEILGSMEWKTEQITVSQDDVGMEEFLEGLDNRLDLYGTGLDDHEKGLLLLMSKSKVLKQDSTLMDYMLVGDIIQSNLVGLQLRLKKLTTVMKMAIENGPSKRKDKEGPRL
ncbi:hypothetical protein L0P88_13540 [Muricauda sp. SCSIO 64092]|uniref:hypothetical protein n=1 Tax=Allomuricauda sp. SCSIO 64092 TaxID=2908842 RepID=UPI001FF5C1CC|nr:hypothetical protein [Muricauda sp. SCSIO 64092]UOY04974.1 hypothetical protein L0P88_13540 [Muricauda sp. SCSIO 64092]